MALFSTRRKVLFARIALAGFALAGAAVRADQAPAVGSLYLALDGGFAHLEDAPIDYAHGALPGRSIGFEPGWGLSGAIGWRTRLMSRVRAELEIGHRENGVKIVTPGNAPGGSTQATSYLVNGYFDIPICSRLRPYVGAGLGFAEIHQTLEADGGTLSDSNSHGFAYQFIGGLEVLLAQRWSATVDYRYLATTSPLFVDRNGLFYNSEYQSHAAFVGLRWRP